jgi:hypothetical protein
MVKVEISLLFNYAYALQMCGEVEVWLHISLTPQLDEGKRLASCPSHFVPKEGTPLPNGLEIV